jgi:hypothetical protein
MPPQDLQPDLARRQGRCDPARAVRRGVVKRPESLTTPSAETRLLARRFPPAHVGVAAPVHSLARPAGLDDAWTPARPLPADPLMDPPGRIRAARKILAGSARARARLGRDSEGKRKEIGEAQGRRAGVSDRSSPHVRHRVRARVTATRAAGERRGYGHTGRPMRPTHSGNVNCCAAPSPPAGLYLARARWPHPHRSLPVSAASPPSIGRSSLGSIRACPTVRQLSSLDRVPHQLGINPSRRTSSNGWDGGE